MSVISSILQRKTTAFSFELLPPLKGNGINGVFNTIDALREFEPSYINITTHRSELLFNQLPNGLYEQVAVRNRPGTVAVAAAIKNKYNISVVPHVLCSGFTEAETEYVLIDLQFLGITDLLLLRGDKAKHEQRFTPTGHTHATDLQQQVNSFNRGYFIDGSAIKKPGAPFSYGMACYPEKHEEAPNLATDLFWAKAKVENGASYLVTQMFFDNKKYIDFVKACRNEGITVPIIPGLKPITLANQLTVLPKIFHVDIPEDLSKALTTCKTDQEAVEVGIEWCTMQAQELKKLGVPSLHFYTMMATESVRRIASIIY
jgi:methylenetetrahydrofolate reductase (NADPH)